MESPPSLFLALRFVAYVRSEQFTGDGYGDFIRILKQFRRRKITSSEAFSTVQTLFRCQNQPGLLDAFNTFKPRNYSAAVEEGSDVIAASVDFLNRVKLRFGGGEVYSKFLNLMHAYSCRQMSASEASDKVVGLFGGNSDLVDEVGAFLPRSKKRRFDDQNQKKETEFDGESRKKKRDLNSIHSKSSSPINSDRAAEERRSAAAKKIKERDNEMEDSMCEIDVRIANLESCRESAERLTRLLSDGAVAAAEFVVAEHFTALNVACMRRADRKILERLGGDVVQALPQLIQILIKNKATLDKQRLKVAQSWTKFRYSSCPSSHI